MSFLSLNNRLWLANILNVVALAWQVATLWEIRNAAGISIPTFIMFAYIQLTFAEFGWRNKNKVTFWGMLVCAALSGSIILTALYFRFP